LFSRMRRTGLLLCILLTGLSACDEEEEEQAPAAQARYWSPARPAAEADGGTPQTARAAQFLAAASQAGGPAAAAPKTASDFDLENLKHTAGVLFDNAAQELRSAPAVAATFAYNGSRPPLSLSRAGKPKPLVGEVPDPGPQLLARRDRSRQPKALRKANRAAQTALEQQLSQLEAAQDLSTLPVLDVVSRISWGARKARAVQSDIASYRITIHHTEGPAAQSARDIQKFHRSKGWNDIGYHYLIYDGSSILEGVPPGVRGTHVRAQNDGNVGIALVGDFNKQVPTGPQVLALIKAAAAVAKRDKMDVDSEAFLLGHRDYARYNSCPGKYLYAMLPKIRALVIRKVKADVGATLSGTSETPLK
ncbi:MAG: peptidoglycan recognition family protein, partial [Elusimicrobia bacterium]|nr:peptidoglycan recognition family protein [Elusimicrobiota bacterium]